MVKEESVSVFTEWAHVTTAHGFLDFSRAKTILGKLIWFLLIIVSLTLMCYQLSRGVKDFVEHEWKTSIQETRQNANSGVPFPSIIACNANRLKYSKIKEYNMTLDMVRFLFMNLIPFNNYLIPYYNKSVEQDFIKWRQSHNFRLKDILEKMGSGKYDSIPSMELDQQNFSSTYTFEYGSKGGAQIIFDTQGWDYLPIVQNNYILEGMALQVTYDGTAEFGKWIMMHPGTHNAVGIQVVEETVREVDKSILNPFALLNSEPPCKRAPRLKFQEDDHYSVTNCDMECSWLIPVHLCNCIPLFSSGQYRECDIEEYFDCFGYQESSFTNGTFTSFISPDLQAIVSECEMQCAKPCFNRYLEATVSQSKFLSDAQAAELEILLPTMGIRQKRLNDTIMLDIYFNSLATKTIELYEAMSFDNLISSSGGLIGLWAGMSFLTIFQIISYCFKYVEQLRAKHRKVKTSVEIVDKSKENHLDS